MLARTFTRAGAVVPRSLASRVSHRCVGHYIPSAERRVASAKPAYTWLAAITGASAYTGAITYGLKRADNRVAAAAV